MISRIHKDKEIQAVAEAVIDTGHRQSILLILLAMWEETKFPVAIMLYLIKQNMVGNALIDYVKMIHGGNAKEAVKTLERQVRGGGTDMLATIVRRN